MPELAGGQPLSFGLVHPDLPSVGDADVEIYPLANDKIIDLDVYYKDPSAVTALLGE